MIHVTEKAAKKIHELLVKEGVRDDSGGLRVGVQGGGCSGLSYAMRLDTQARDRDKVFEENGARLFVDPKSYLYLRRHDSRLRRDADAPGLRVSESAGRAQLRLRQLVHRLAVPKQTGQGNRRREPLELERGTKPRLAAGFARHVLLFLWGHPVDFMAAGTSPAEASATACWSCGAAADGAHFCAACGKIQPLAARRRLFRASGPAAETGD